ncbi:MAG TPA: hypothetical protein VG164_10890 [Trebonia sp.]|jgi:hypothetical protein|nr:hypothetical protein [Trebonia sp.]
MTVPAGLARLLAGRPDVGAAEQAFPLLTVDDAGFPHVALLSKAEIDVTPDGSAVLAVIASRRTRANLGRDGRAGLIAIGGTVAHYAKLSVVRAIDTPAALGCVLRVAEHKADSLGIPLSPIGFVTTAPATNNTSAQSH